MKYRKGWFGENYRHYLASKGISTKRYFVRDDLKGNRGKSALHSLYQAGYSQPEIATNPVIPASVRNEAIEALTKKKSKSMFPDLPKLPGGDAPSTSRDGFPSETIMGASATTITPLPSESVPLSEPEPSVATMPGVFTETPELQESPEAEVGLSANITDEFADTGADESESNTVTSPVSTPGVPGMAPSLSEDQLR